MTIIWCMVPEIWSATDRIFCHSEPFFALLPHYRPRKLKFWKNEQQTWRCYHFTNHKWQQSYGVWFLRYEAWRTDKIFCHFGLFFCHFTPLTTWKIKILKKWKKLLELLAIILHKCTKNHDHMLLLFLRLSDACNCYFSFGIFFPFYPCKPKNWKFPKNEKNAWRYYHFTHVHQKSWSYVCYTVPEVWRCDGCNCYFLFWVIFAFLPPNLLKKLKF